MGTEIATHGKRVQALETTIRTNTKLNLRLAEVLPKAIGTSPERFLSTVFTVLAADPQLAKCTPPSIMTGILRAAQAGLELDGVQSALVPYGNTATYVPMYQGYIRAMYRSGIVARIQVPRLVYKGDLLEYEYGLHEKLRHVPQLDHTNQSEGNVLCGYCVVTLQTGETVWEIVPRRRFDAIRARAPKGGPWRDHYEAMCQKTTVRSVAKYVAQRAEQAAFSQMVARDEKLDAGIVEKPENFDEPGQTHLSDIGDIFAREPEEQEPMGAREETDEELFRGVEEH